MRGQIHRDTGDDEPAQAQFAVALELATSLALRAQANHGLATIREKQGKYAEAVDLFQTVLAIRREQYGEQHWKTALAMQRLASAMVGAGDVAEGRELLESTLEGLARALGPDSPRLVSGMNRLANALVKEGRPERALEHYERALALGRRSRETSDAEGPLQADRRDLNLLGNIGGLLLDLGRYEPAVEMLERALAAAESDVGASHFKTATVRLSLSQAYRGVGRKKDGARQLDLALAALEESGRDNRPGLLMALLAASEARRADGDLTGARAAIGRAEEVVRLLHEPAQPHPHHAMVAGQRGLLERTIGDHLAAVTAFERCAEVTLAVHTADHPQRVYCVYWGGRSLEDLGKDGGALLDEAVKLVRAGSVTPSLEARILATGAQRAQARGDHEKKTALVAAARGLIAEHPDLDHHSAVAGPRRPREVGFSSHFQRPGFLPNFAVTSERARRPFADEHCRVDPKASDHIASSNARLLRTPVGGHRVFQSAAQRHRPRRRRGSRREHFGNIDRVVRRDEPVLRDRIDQPAKHQQHRGIRIGHTSGSEEESTAGPMPMCDDVCAPDPGDGWTGPFAVAGAVSGCASDYPAQGDLLFGDLEPGDASCECECLSPSVTCSTEITGTLYGSNFCSAAFSMGSLDPGDCVDTGFSGYSVALGEASSECAEGSVSSTLPEPTWGTSIATCTGDAIEGVCPDPGDTCFPQPADPLGPELCVASEGDVLCPSGYPSKTVYFRDFTDDRSCPASCSCTPTTPTCSVDVWRSDASGHLLRPHAARHDHGRVRGLRMCCGQQHRRIHRDRRHRRRRPRRVHAGRCRCQRRSERIRSSDSLLLVALRSHHPRREPAGRESWSSPRAKAPQRQRLNPMKPMSTQTIPSGHVISPPGGGRATAGTRRAIEHAGLAARRSGTADRGVAAGRIGALVGRLAEGPCTCCGSECRPRTATCSTRLYSGGHSMNPPVVVVPPVPPRLFTRRVRHLATAGGGRRHAAGQRGIGVRVRRVARRRIGRSSTWAARWSSWRWSTASWCSASWCSGGVVVGMSVSVSVSPPVSPSSVGHPRQIEAKTTRRGARLCMDRS